MSVPSNLGHDGVPSNVALARRGLHKVLIGAADRAGVNVRTGRRSRTSTRNRATSSCPTARPADYDAIVGFDGINSPLRARLFPDAKEPAYTGFAVWRVTVPRPEHLDHGALYQAVGAKGGHIPLSQETMYLLLVTPEPHARALRPGAVPGHAARAAGAVRAACSPTSARACATATTSSTARCPRCSCRAPWRKGRAVICGDAAHACVPHTTQGAAMALEDAVVLGDELVQDRPAAESLAAFADRRYPRAKFVQDVSRGILNGEMAITAENIGHAFEHMRAELPGQFAGVDAFLNNPA